VVAYTRFIALLEMTRFSAFYGDIISTEGRDLAICWYSIWSFNTFEMIR